MMMAATLVAASPVFAQGSNNTNPRRAFGNFGPTSDAVGRANPGNQARERPTDPSQFRSLPGFVAPSQSQPTTPLLPDSTGQTPGRWLLAYCPDLIPLPLEPSRRHASIAARVRGVAVTEQTLNSNDY